MRVSTIVTLSALLSMAPLPGRGVQAQIGVTTDVLTGVVTDANDRPLRGVTIEALSLETQIVRTATTDARGRFTILFPDGGGQYQMTARAIGMVPLQTTLVRYADEDRLEWNAQLQSQAFRLAEIEVRGVLTPVRIPDPATPGSVERLLTPDQIAALPIDASDLNVLATLVPGVVGLDATDSTTAAFSVAGLRDDANALTLDGMTFGSGELPQEGLRATRVVTSTYDVSRGRFSGGLVQAISRGGTNTVQGLGSYQLRDDGLAFSGEEGGSPFATGFTQNALSGGMGGPIAANRLFVFASMQGRLRTDPQPSLTAATSTDLYRLGVHPDSVARLTSIVDALGAGPELRTDRSRSNDQLSGLLRFDYLVSNNHTLTVRGDWRGTDQEPTRLGRTSLPEVGGVNTSSSGGVQTSLASRLGTRWLNEARAYVSSLSRNGDSFQDVPRGRVQVASSLPDGSLGISTLVFGGNGAGSTRSRETFFQASNELSWLPGTGSHRVRFGGLLTAERSTDLVGANQLGTYTFNSLADLEAGRPASFRRTVVPDERRTTAWEWALYAGDIWRSSSRFQLTWGLRVEGSRFGNVPGYNAALDSALGVRTDRLPSQIAVSPRAGFTWTIGATGFGAQPAFIVRGGAGLFRSPTPNGLATQAQVATGLADATSDLNCIGTAVPTPDWASYQADANTIPATCAGPSTPLSVGAPSATVFSDDFRSPGAWRASLGVQRSLTPLLRLSVDGSYARGINQYGFRDINLDTSRGFALSSEGNRPVFVAAADVVPGTGAVRLSDSRRDPAFAQVLEIDSDLASDTKQLSISLGGFTRRGVGVQTSYTWSHARDQSSASSRFGGFGIGTATTAGDPNVREWSRSSFERRHSFLTTIRYPFGTSLEITAIGRVNSGRPYTPIVASDINGDGARNDRAFIFAPGGATPSALSNGMTGLLATSSSGARSCLATQLGQVAERNSCLGPWEGSFDLQVNYRPTVFGLDRRLSVSVVTVNLLRGIDELFHGASGAKGWGLRSQPDPTLLFVTGFDPATNAFTYAVNERFGATRSDAQAFRAPFQIGIQARLSLGPDRVRDAVDRLRGAGRGGGGAARGGGLPGGRGGFGGGRPGAGFGGGGFTPDNFLERFRSLLPNPAGLVLDLRDSVELTDAQVVVLTALRDTITAAIDSIAAELQTALEEAGPAQNPRALLDVMRPYTEDARAILLRRVETVRGILTPEQWERLPAPMRNMGRFGPRRRRPGN